MDDEIELFKKIELNIQIAISQNKTPALAYERVSSEQQRSGTSLEVQHQGAREYADRNNILIVHQFEVAESAFKPHRKVFNQLIDYALRFDIKILLLKSTDRMSRNFKDWEILNGLMETNDICIHFYLNNRVLNRNMVFIQDMNMDMELMFAKFHSKKISHDIKEMNKHKASKGIAPYTTAPFGYTYDKEIKRFIKNPKTQSDVEFMFDEFDTFKYSLGQFVDLLEAKGIKTPTGRPVWQRSQLRALLANCFYHGEFSLRQQNKILKGNHEPYYDKNRYEKRMEMLSSKYIGHKRRNFDFALSGMVRCTCGKLMTGDRLKIKVKGGKIRTKLIYVHKCPDKPKRTTGEPGGQISIYEDKLFEILDKKIKESTFSENFATNLKILFKNYVDDSQDKHVNERKIVSRKINNLFSQKDRLLDAYSKQIINDTDALNEKIQNLNLQIEHLEKQKCALEINNDKLIITIAEIIDKLRDFGRVYAQSSFKGKAELLNSMTTDIIIEDNEPKIIWDKPFSFMMEPCILELKAENDTKIEQGSCLYNRAPPVGLEPTTN